MSATIDFFVDNLITNNFYKQLFSAKVSTFETAEINMKKSWNPTLTVIVNLAYKTLGFLPNVIILDTYQNHLQ